MRRLLLVVFLVGGALAGCRGTAARPVPPAPTAGPRPIDVVVEVRGSYGLAFEGWVGEPGRIQTVRGAVPQRFPISARRSVVVTVQKTTAGGVLAARLVIAGATVLAGATQRPYGLVVLRHRLDRASVPKGPPILSPPDR